MDDILRVSGLTVYYYAQHGRRVVKAVDGISFSLKKGESLGIVGESGCGKTTTSMSIVRMLPPAAKIVSGEVWFDGRDLTKLSNAEIRRVRGKGIAVILQDPSVALNPLFTVGEQVSESLRLHQGLHGKDLSRRGTELLKKVRIPSPEVRMKQYPHEMSGGMKQRIVGAIALAGEPKLIIADEPTTSLDVTIQAQYLNLLKTLQEETGVSLIFITHNLGIVAKMCHDVAVMYAGKIVERGPVRTIFNHGRHPYTIALIESLPKLGTKKKLTAIPGQPPNLANARKGCSFAPRCSMKLPQCEEEEPPEMRMGQENYWVNCWRAGETE